MTGPEKTERVQLVISPAELERLDAWRGPRRIWSRSAAIRQLIAEGIDRDEKREARRKKAGEQENPEDAE